MKPAERRVVCKLRDLGEEDLADEVEDVLYEHAHRRSLEELGAAVIQKLPGEYRLEEA